MPKTFKWLGHHRVWTKAFESTLAGPGEASTDKKKARTD